MKHYLNAMVAYTIPDHVMSFFVQNSSLTKYGTKKRIQLRGKRGVAAVQKEMQQFCNCRIISPINPSKMTKDDMKKSLAYLMFLKEKQYGSIKGWGCANGRNQRFWYDKQERSAPAVMIESLFLTSVIDTKKGWDVATVDILGAFLQAKSKDNPTIWLNQEMVWLLVEINKSYKKFVTQEWGIQVMYGKAEQNLYGTVDTALDFYKIFLS